MLGFNVSNVRVFLCDAMVRTLVCPPRGCAETASPNVSSDRTAAPDNTRLARLINFICDMSVINRTTLNTSLWLRTAHKSRITLINITELNNEYQIIWQHITTHKRCTKTGYCEVRLSYLLNDTIDTWARSRRQFINKDVSSTEKRIRYWLRLATIKLYDVRYWLTTRQVTTLVSMTPRRLSYQPVLSDNDTNNFKIVNELPKCNLHKKLETKLHRLYL